MCCDCCGKAGAKKRRCHYGYCPPPAICPTCWDKPEIKESMSAKNHQKCKEWSAEHKAREEKEKALYAAGKVVRWSAIGIEGGYVAVSFRASQFTRDAKKYIMKKEIYDSIPLLEPATPEDYAFFGEIKQIAV